MRLKVLTALAMWAAMATSPRAELTARFDLSGFRVGNIVVCSQYPQLNAERLKGFLKEAIRIRPEFRIMDGPHKFVPTDLARGPAPKLLLLAAEQEPNQLVKECVQETVPFGDKVFQQASKVWSGIGKPIDDGLSLGSVIDLSLLPPVSQAHSYSFVEDSNGRREWVIFTMAASGKGGPHAINNTMISVFGLDTDICQENSFCLTAE
ncbi:hypothetical protein [Leisingera sp. S232]|uniref:hypothetical protein n=1 Tax=Leisingera sp. S232 TaxID=3415132 RepID=UPI003C7B953B